MNFFLNSIKYEPGESNSNSPTFTKESPEVIKEQTPLLSKKYYDLIPASEIELKI